jgi:hypothetical protein
MARRPADEVQLKLRFRERLRQRLERAASKNSRSMNAEIVHRLEESFTEEDLATRVGRRLKADTDAMKREFDRQARIMEEDLQLTRELNELSRKYKKLLEETGRKDES